MFRPALEPIATMSRGRFSHSRLPRLALRVVADRLQQTVRGSPHQPRCGFPDSLSAAHLPTAIHPTSSATLTGHAPR